MRAVIYARFSSALQNSRSIEDQIVVCRERCEREGWQISEVFTDYAISGAAGIDENARPGLNSLLARVEAGGIDRVVAESTDRIARHQGDAFTIRERIEFSGARLFTLSDGEITDITATFKGLMDSQFRKELGAKVKRGQRGTVSQGRIPAGMAYGYRKANRLLADGELIRGLREIDDNQARVVLRIFEEYAAGESPRAIAGRLNAETVPGPRGGIWRQTTIAGDRKRQNGILQNRIYIGMIVHDRTRKISDPRTRRTLIRANDENTWLSSEAPHLRIVIDDLWERVQAVRSRYATQPHRAKRAKHLLSGKASCGCCGAGWIIIGTGRWACSAHREGGAGACVNNRSITTEQFEARVLDGLQSQMLAPDLVEIYVREYHIEHARRSKELDRSDTELRRAIKDAKARVARLLKAFEQGGGEFAEIRDMLAAAKADVAEYEQQLTEMETLPVIALHPHVIADYRSQVAGLSAALADNPSARLEAIPKLRSLIDHIAIIPKPDSLKGVAIEVTGRLNSMLAIATNQPTSDECVVLMERVRGSGHSHTLLKVAV